MDKGNNIVYAQTKNGIFKCYKSEQMHKPIYYPIESKTNGYIDYYDVIEILNIDDLYEQCKKQKEINQKAIEYIKERFYFNEETGEYALLHTFDKCNVKELLDILKEVSK